jgi:hypothetical protein
MAASGRQHDLLRQIPDDVRQRADKAGVSKIDWYAGRLTEGGGTGFSDLPPDRHDRLRKSARARRDRRMKQKTDGVKTSVVNAVAWVWRSPRRLLRHTS